LRKYMGRSVVRRVIEESLLINSNIAKTWHYIFARRGTLIKQTQQLSARVYALTVEDQSNVSLEDVKTFSEHCVYARSIYLVAERLFKSCTEDAPKLMDSIVRTQGSPHFSRYHAIKESKVRKTFPKGIGMSV
jgi:hypothetical protein